MKSRYLLSVVGMSMLAGSMALGQQQPSSKPAPAKPTATQPSKPAPAQAAKPTTAQPGKDGHAQPGMDQLPPGMTPEMMQACMQAGTPGAMHEFLAQGVGEWTGSCTMWMAAGTPPMKSESTMTITPMMDGRFFKYEHKGEMMGQPFNGFGLTGFDNVSQKFQSSWVDNFGTGMMFGTGELSSDKSTLTMTYTFNCPIQKKPVTMREVEHFNGDHMTMEMFGPDMATGKEYKMMEIEFTKKGAKPATAPATGH